MTNNIERMIIIIELRAKRELENNNIKSAKEAIMESFDLQRDTGFIRQSTINLANRVNNNLVTL